MLDDESFPVNAPKVETRFVQFLAVSWFLGVLAIFLFYPPYWALMDDGQNLLYAQSGFDGMNLLEFVWNFTLHEGIERTGRFQPVYPLFMYLFYGFFAKSHFAAYLFTFFLNVIVFWIWAFLFARCMGKSQTGFYRNNTSYQWFFFLLCFLFTPHYNLFFYASLAERLVLLFASVAFYGMVRVGEKEQPAFWPSCLLVVGCLLAILSKEFSIFLLPPFVVWLFIFWLKRRNLGFLGLSLFLFLMGAFFCSYLLSIKAGYSSQYELSSLSALFSKIDGRFLLFGSFALFAFCILLVRHFRAKDRDLSTTCYLLVWPLDALCFLCVMLPWGNVGTYYAVSAGVFFIGNFLIVQDCLLHVLRRYGIVRSIVMFAFLAPVSFYAMGKLSLEAKQHHGTGKAVAFLKKEMSVSDRELMVRFPDQIPCYESSVRMSFFIGKDDAVKWLGALPWYSDGTDPFLTRRDLNVRKLLILNKECTKIPSAFEIQKTVFRYPPWYIYEGEVQNPVE